MNLRSLSIFGRRATVPSATELLSRTRVTDFAQAALDRLFRRGYDGEVFLCGGAFKTLIRGDLPINDLDLWVRDDRERDRCRNALTKLGARVVRDFVPHCVRMECNGTAVEITYGNLGAVSIADLVRSFDLAVCSIGVAYYGGRVIDCFIDEKAVQSVSNRTLYFNGGYVDALRTDHHPRIVVGLDRVEKAAAELAYAIPGDEVQTLWNLYREYSREERKACVNEYLNCIVDYKGRCNIALLRQAVALL